MKATNKGIIVTALLALILLGLPASVLATAQQPDILLYKGKTYYLFANPLEDFYKGKKDRPQFRVMPNLISTGNWRGYVATWTVEDGFLYLIKIDGWICSGMKESNCKEVSLNKLFGDKYRNKRVRADWFSGDLKMPDGEMLQYVHMGYGSVYERELILQVASGKVVKDSLVDNTKRTLPSGYELELQELEKMKPKPQKP